MFTSERARQVWNRALRPLRQAELISTPEAAADMAVLYLNFVTGAVTVFDKDRGQGIALSFAGAREAEAAVSRAVTTLAYEQGEDWEVDGQWTRGDMYEFAVQFRRSGEVRGFFIQRGKRQ